MRTRKSQTSQKPIVTSWTDEKGKTWLSFWKETQGGAIPVPLACKILKCSDVTIYRYIKSGKLNGYKFNKTVLVSINDVEKLLDEPKNKGGRPVKENT